MGRAEKHRRPDNNGRVSSAKAERTGVVGGWRERNMGPQCQTLNSGKLVLNSGKAYELLKDSGELLVQCLF